MLGSGPSTSLEKQFEGPSAFKLQDHAGQLLNDRLYFCIKTEIPTSDFFSDSQLAVWSFAKYTVQDKFLLKLNSQIQIMADITTLMAVAIGPLTFGYHISCLNSPKTAIIGNCYYQGDCIPMSDADYSFVVSVLPLAGLAGAFLASPMLHYLGYRRLWIAVALKFLTSAITLATATTASQLIMGRFIVGTASGLSLVVAPLWLMDVSSHFENQKLKSLYASATQIGIVLGILIGSILGLAYAEPGRWRSILWFPISFSILQIILTRWVDVPVQSHLKVVNVQDEPESPSSEIHSPFADDDVQVDNIHATHVDSTQSIPSNTLGRKLFNPSVYATVITISLQICQQFTGINAVLFYSTPIFSSILPTNISGYISILIALVNLLVTFLVPSVLHKLGLRDAMVLSCVWTGVSVLFVGLGLALSVAWLAAMAILAYIAFFAIGLGPVPFLVVPGLTSHHPAVASYVQSLGIAANWISNFVIGIGFPVWREAIGEWIWVIFAATCFLAAWIARTGLAHEARHSPSP